MTSMELLELAPDFRGLRRSEYDAIARTGAFEGERVELLHGRIVRMSPISGAHNYAVRALTRRLILGLGDRAQVHTQMSFAASDDTEPEPDIAVVPPGRYVDDHPDRAHLIIEVAQSSLRRDRGLKAELYAAAGVPEYWVVDLEHDCVIVFTVPVGSTYTRTRTAGRSEQLAPAAFPDLSIPIDAILP